MVEYVKSPTDRMKTHMEKQYAAEQRTISSLMEANKNLRAENTTLRQKCTENEARIFQLQLDNNDLEEKYRNLLVPQ
jgi:hypothetical protein